VGRNQEVEVANVGQPAANASDDIDLKYTGIGPQLVHQDQRPVNDFAGVHRLIPSGD
jgi:hypothetical protein